MAYLPLANILHHRLRSTLSALGIGIGVCMLVTLSGLSRGSLNEVADRWESVDAELIVYPAGLGENVTTLSGIGLPDKHAEQILAKRGDLVERVTPVFLWQIKLAGQNHTAVGVDPEHWHTLAGGCGLEAGRLFDSENKFAKWLEAKLLIGDEGDETIFDPTEADLSDPRHNGLELVIDTRLAKAGNLRLNQTVFAANHHWRIVGIVPDGAMARIFMPRRTAQFLFGFGNISKSTLMFVKLHAGVDAAAAAKKLRGTRQDVIQLRQYRDMLQEKFGIMYRYVDAVNAIALIIAFLFIMTTLYTIVLQQTREIAILKSFGASKGLILRQVLAESAILTAAGTVMGVAMSFVAAWLVEVFCPLLTVTITWHWVLIAVAAATVGAFLSGLYPAWRATRVDMVAALTLE